jgi:hypothetical protein
MDSFWTGLAIGAVLGPLVMIGALEAWMQLQSLRPKIACWRRGHDWRRGYGRRNWHKQSCTRCLAYRIIPDYAQSAVGNRENAEREVARLRPASGPPVA